MMDDALENGVMAIGSQIGAGAESWQKTMAFWNRVGKGGAGLRGIPGHLQSKIRGCAVGEGLQSNQRRPLGGQ